MNLLPTKYEDLAPFYAEKLAAAVDKDNEAIKNGQPPTYLHHMRRILCLSDLFYLLTVELKCGFMLQHPNRQWLLDRCREVQAKPNGYIDLWAREHFKSTIITYGLTIQDILKNPEVTIGIFSWKRPVAVKFMRQIMQTFKMNDELKGLFPDVLWADPEKQAPKWSEQDGIIVRRVSTPKESTVEAHGVVEGQPVGAHFQIRIYDDLVTKDSVNTEEMMAKVLDAYQMSDNLGTEGGHERVIGTRYHFGDAYGWMLNQGKPARIYPATDDGTETGVPVLMSSETLRNKRKSQGPSVFATQMLLNPKGGSQVGFEESWLQYYKEPPKDNRMNTYLIVDPANKKKKRSDYTAMVVIGVTASKHYYKLYMMRDKLTLTERTQKVFELAGRYSVKHVGYEEYGMQSDIDHIESVMDQEGMRIRIKRLGGKLSKHDRILTLQPLYEAGRIIMPQKQMYTNFEKVTEDMVNVFVEQEYKAFPLAQHDDILDVTARITDPEMDIRFPMSDFASQGRRFTDTVNKYDHFKK